MMRGEVTEPISFLYEEDRLLQDDANATETIHPTPTFAPFNDRIDTDDGIIGDEGARSFGIIFLAAFVVVALFVGWRSIKIWRARRERHMMQVQSTRADAVLGDMQVSHYGGQVLVCDLEVSHTLPSSLVSC
jgi:hypothetical protein